MTSLSDNSDRYQRAIGTFHSRAATEEALHTLRQSGFNMDLVSVIAKNSEDVASVGNVKVRDRDEPIDNKADEGAATGAAAGGAAGTIAGLLVGLGALAIPGVGPILLAGAGATALATTLAGTAIGAAAGGLLGGLIGLGIPEDEARIYNDRISRGDYLVMITGGEVSVRMAEAILRENGIEELRIYNIPAPVNADRTLPDNDLGNIVVDRRDEIHRTL